MRKKSVVLATPCYGGMVTSKYMGSMLDSIYGLMRDSIPHINFMLANESLIPRGRNKCAMWMLDNNFDKLMFIDADMIWTYEKLKMLLDSDKPIIGGTYPMKAFPISLNFNALEGKGLDLFAKNRQQDNYLEFVRAHADAKGEVEVRHIPTGFMLIDRTVFLKLSETVPSYFSYDPPTKTTTAAYDFFPSGIVEGISEPGEYLSEDWAFCAIAKRAGFPIYLQTRAVCGHTGTFNFGLGQHVVIGQEPLIK